MLTVSPSPGQSFPCPCRFAYTNPSREIEQFGSIGEARRRLQIQEALQVEPTVKSKSRSGDIPLPVAEIDTSRIADLVGPARIPFDGKVLAWGLSRSLWNDPKLLAEAHRDLSTFQSIVESRLCVLGVSKGRNDIAFWTREAELLKFSVCSCPFPRCLSF